MILLVGSDYAGYLLSYFTGEETPDGEQIRFALSQGNDPLRWRALNDGRPVLTATRGERGVRGPFLIRAPAGDRFYLLGTDPRLHGDDDGDRARRTGSRCVAVWESTDLVHWSDQRLVGADRDRAQSGLPFGFTGLAAEVWTPCTGEVLPGNPRHGSVLPVTRAEYDRLLRAYQPDRVIERIEPVTVHVAAGQEPVLPDWVSATFADGNYRPAAVTWDDLPPQRYARPGTVTVRGRLADASLAGDAAPGAARIRAQVRVNRLPVAGLVLRYEFDEAAGGRVVRDSSGRGNHGTYHGAPAFGTGVRGRSLRLTGGGAGGAADRADAGYVSLPNGVLADAEAITVTAYVKWAPSITANQWLFSLGPGRTRCLFVTPRTETGALYCGITGGGPTAEAGLDTGAALLDDRWRHLALVVDPTAGTAALYLDGLPVARATGVPLRPGDLHDPAAEHAGYLGRALEPTDLFFAGEVDDFRVYDRVLTPAEIYALGGCPAGVAAVTLPQLKVDALIDATAGRIMLPVRPGTDLRRLGPWFATAPGARVSPRSGTIRDLTGPVTYTVTGADGAWRPWTVRARVMSGPVLAGHFADPNIVVFDGRFYLYPTTDGFSGWRGTRLRAFSSVDLVHWTDHGVVLDLATDVTWAQICAWAPAVAARNGRYYLYFSGGMATGDTGKHLGVAVADSPTGPFRDALGAPLVPAGRYPGQMIDPAVLVDDDGRAYLYWGNGDSYQVPLGDDMVSFDPAQVHTFRPPGYNEGSFVFKRAGRYYFTWSENDTRSEDYQVAYAVGPSPLGPWGPRRGPILAKDLALGIRGTGHQSVVCAPGTDDWYIAYHRFAIPYGDGTHREVTIDRLEFDADGAIRPVVPTLAGVDPLRPAPAHTQRRREKR